MKTLVTLAACAVIGTVVIDRANSQGPVREGLRRTGEIAVEGTRRVIQGAGQAAAGVARGTGQIVGGAADATARAVRGGVRVLTPGVPWQARADANLQAFDAGREARWRFQQHNGEWWYYTPENAWMYHRDGDWHAFNETEFQTNPAIATEGQQLAADGQPLTGEHAAGYRGLEPTPEASNQQVDAGAQSQLFVDRCGRHYICENGQRVYVDVSGAGQAWQSGYRGEPGHQGEMTPAIPDEANPATQQSSAAASSQSQTAPQTGAAGSAEATTEPPAAASPPAEPTPGAAADATNAPESPREINNNPDTALEGDATTSGTGDGDVLR